jgi:hypothetical protein
MLARPAKAYMLPMTAGTGLALKGDVGERGM